MNSEDPWKTSWRGEEVSGQGFGLTYGVGTILALNTMEKHRRWLSRGMTALFKKIVSGNHVEGARDRTSREAISVVQAAADESWDENNEIDGLTPAGRMKVACTGLKDGRWALMEGGIRKEIPLFPTCVLPKQIAEKWSFQRCFRQWASMTAVRLW